MAITLSRKAQIVSHLQDSGSVTRLSDSESSQKREAINNQVRKVRRDFQKKERKSQISAARLTLTA